MQSYITISKYITYFIRLFIPYVFYVILYWSNERLVCCTRVFVDIDLRITCSAQAYYTLELNIINQSIKSWFGITITHAVWYIFSFRIIFLADVNGYVIHRRATESSSIADGGLISNRPRVYTYTYAPSDKSHIRRRIICSGAASRSLYVHSI